MKDITRITSVNQSIASQSVTSGNAATNGAGVSTTNFDGVAGLFRLSARTDGTYTPKFQLSADGTNWYDLDAAGYVGKTAPAAQNAVGNLLFGMAEPLSSAAVAAGVDPLPALKNVRIVVTQAGGTTGATFQADVLLTHPRHGDLQSNQI